MSYHDKRLAVTGHKGSERVKRNAGGFVIRGALTVNLFQTMPRIPGGSVAGDWKKVGGDIRTAMRKVRAECD